MTRTGPATHHPKATAALGALAALLVTGSGAASAGAQTGRFSARGSIEQVQVSGVSGGSRLTLVDRRGRRVARRRAGSLGGAVFRGVVPGTGYRVLRRGARSRRLTVLSARSAPPSTGGYRQRIPATGYGYLTTRDGTKLAIDVHRPPGAGPYPTLIEYSGYGYADPAGGESSIAPIATALGFAVVNVNMRGTGCSGGAFDYFERLQALDGYDVVETVARQPWAMHHEVGMMGISYGGISQLFVAATAPPSLAAIAPLSVLDDSAATLYPGGILNTGFAVDWARDRVHDARPASRSGGQRWALERIRHGDRTCRANQALHEEAIDLVAKIRRNRHYVPSVADPLAPSTFVHRIAAPVFLACQWTDEQTGGHCPAIARHFTGTRRKWFTFTNGTHIDSLDPATLTRWFDFLELYVAHRAPRLSPEVRALTPTIFSLAMGIPGQALPADPIQAQPTYRRARAAFERLPSVRILFDNGAGSATPGAPVAAFERSFSRFPLPRTHARSWYLARGGALRRARPATAGHDAFTWSPRARPPTSFTGGTGAGPGGLWTATPPYRWSQARPGTALAYVTAPLGSATTVAGAGALQAWVRSSAPSVDLQVTVSEVRPDGMETFVQNGWLRTSARALDPRRSTRLAPVPSLRRSDSAPLPPGRWTRVTVPLYYQGHVYRAGSRLRVMVAAPRGDQPVWSFGGIRPKHPASVSLAHAPDAVARGAPRRLRGPRAHRPAAVPGPARGALPSLPTTGEPPMTPSTTGRCLCGGVRFELTRPVEAAGYCHCTRCQRRTGTGSSAQAGIDGRTFRLLAGEELVKAWRHPDGGFEKCFCRECGAHLFSRDPDDPAQMGVRLGAFDGDPGVRPAWRTFVAHAAPWEPLPDDGLERYPEQRP